MNNFAMPRPDLSFGGPGQILAVALQEQQASWVFYTSAVATHGNQAPLQTLLDSTAQRITLLGNLYQQFGVPLPVLSAPTPEPLVTGWRETLERAMQGTFGSAGVYQQLVTFTPDPTLRREFERLQSDLLTRDLPALQRAWQAAVDRERLHAAQGIDPAQAHASHGIIGDAMEGLFALLTRQGGYLGFTGTVLKALNPMLVAGALVGGLAVHGTRQAGRRRTRRCSTTTCDLCADAPLDPDEDDTHDINGLS